MTTPKGEPSMRKDEEGLPTKITQALARGYCYEANKNKELDGELIKAMSHEILAVIQAERQEVERLKEYVQHNQSCDYDHPNPDRASCDCGLEEALASPSDAKDEK